MIASNTNDPAQAGPAPADAVTVEGNLVILAPSSVYSAIGEIALPLPDSLLPRQIRLRTYATEFRAVAAALEAAADKCRAEIAERGAKAVAAQSASLLQSSLSASAPSLSFSLSSPSQATGAATSNVQSAPVAALSRVESANTATNSPSGGATSAPTDNAAGSHNPQGVAPAQEVARPEGSSIPGCASGAAGDSPSVASVEGCGPGAVVAGGRASVEGSEPSAGASATAIPLVFEPAKPCGMCGGSRVVLDMPCRRCGGSGVAPNDSPKAATAPTTPGEYVGSLVAERDAKVLAEVLANNIAETIAAETTPGVAGAVNNNKESIHERAILDRVGPGCNPGSRGAGSVAAQCGDGSADRSGGASEAESGTALLRHGGEVAEHEAPAAVDHDHAQRADSVLTSIPLPILDSRSLLTNSRKKTFRACQRKHHIAYELGIRPVRDSEVLFFGDLCHKGLEAWYSALDDSERLAAALAVIDAIPEADENSRAGVDPFTRAKARALLIGYEARWNNEEDSPYEILAVEKQFAVPFTDDFIRAGKLDVLLRDLRDSRYAVMDHKTTTQDFSPGSDFWKRLRLDSQVSEYFAGGAAILGRPVDVWIHDVLKTPGQRPYKATPEAERKYTKPKYAKHDACKGAGCADCGAVVGAPAGKVLVEASRLHADQRERDETPSEYERRILDAIAEAPDSYFARGEVVRLDAEIAEYESENFQVAHLMSEARRTGFNPRNVDACVMYGSTCSYFAVCCSEASLDDPTLFRKVDNVHPELNLGPTNAA